MKRMDWKTIGKRIAIGVLGLTATALALCGLFGVLVVKETVDMEMSKTVLQVLCLVGLFAVCWFLARSVPKQRLMVSVVTAIAVTLICLLIKVCGFPKEVWHAAPAVVILMVGVIAGFAACGKKTRKR